MSEPKREETLLEMRDRHDKEFARVVMVIVICGAVLFSVVFVSMVRRAARHPRASMERAHPAPEASK